MRVGLQPSQHCETRAWPESPVSAREQSGKSRGAFSRERGNISKSCLAKMRAMSQRITGYTQTLHQRKGEGVKNRGAGLGRGGPETRKVGGRAAQLHKREKNVDHLRSYGRIQLNQKNGTKIGGRFRAKGGKAWAIFLFAMRKN